MQYCQPDRPVQSIPYTHGPAFCPRNPLTGYTSAVYHRATHAVASQSVTPSGATTKSHAQIQCSNLHQSLASTFIPTNSRLAIHKTHRVLQRIVERLIKKQRSKAE